MDYIHISTVKLIKYSNIFVRLIKSIPLHISDEYYFVIIIILMI